MRKEPVADYSYNCNNTAHNKHGTSWGRSQLLTTPTTVTTQPTTNMGHHDERASCWVLTQLCTQTTLTNACKWRTLPKQLSTYDVTLKAHDLIYKATTPSPLGVQEEQTATHWECFPPGRKGHSSRCDWSWRPAYRRSGDCCHPLSAATQTQSPQFPHKLHAIYMLRLHYITSRPLKEKNAMLAVFILTWSTVSTSVVTKSANPCLYNVMEHNKYTSRDQTCKPMSLYCHEAQ